MTQTPPRQPDCRLSNLVLEGGRSVCYRPQEHRGYCGVLSDEEIERTYGGMGKTMLRKIKALCSVNRKPKP